MKKSYMKPAITFECLNVSANIASGCAYISTNNAEYVCAVEDPESGWTIFSDYANCMYVTNSNDTVCYDIPFANSNVFES